MAKPGRKPDPPRGKPNAPIDPTPPSGLKGRPAKLYSEIASDLKTEGYVSQAEAKLVLILAHAYARMELLQAKLDATTDILADESRRLEDRIAKLVASIVRVEGQLLNTPRSRSSSRLASDSGRKGEAQPDELDLFNGAKP